SPEITSSSRIRRSSHTSSSVSSVASTRPMVTTIVRTGTGADGRSGSLRHPSSGRRRSGTCEGSAMAKASHARRSVSSTPTRDNEPMPVPARTRLAARAGLAVAYGSRLAGHGGSVLGGRVTLALDARALPRLSEGRTIALVSGTNGKTTTTGLLAAALGTGGSVVTNDSGANLPYGLVAALTADLAAGTAVLEVGEGALPPVVAATRPAVVVLLNLSRDQLDRYGEVRMIAARWRGALADAPGAHVVANADDPIMVWAARAA